MSAASKARRKARRTAEGRPLASFEPPWPHPVPIPPGRVNVYRCGACGLGTVTIDIHKGVTPFILGRPYAAHAPGCKGIAYSSMYRPPADHGEPTLEWYGPSRAEARRAGDAMFDHARKGGLFLRPRSAHPDEDAR